jgi:very-short-patch-repair endonuclease
MKLPSPVPSGHPLPQGERGMIRPLTQVAKEQQERRRNLPSPLAGEGVSRRLTGEEFAREQAKRLRHDMTEAETKLWHALRGRRFEGYKFRRQVAIGNFIVDFVCYAQRLIVELDGSQHEGSQHDKQRDAWLESQGFQVLRLWNNHVLGNLDFALVAILHALTQHSPASQERGTLSGKRRGEKEENLPSPFTGECAPKGRERDVKNVT